MRKNVKITPNIGAITLLKQAISTLFEHKEILFPFCITAFIQLLFLEILYFYPRYPLNIFFGPLVRRQSELYMHYPFNFIYLPNLYQYVQIFIYIFVSVYFIATAVGIIESLNNEKKVKIKQAFKKSASAYVHLVINSLLSFALVTWLFKLTKLLVLRAMQIRSSTGIFFILKKSIILGAPYINLVFSVFVTTLFLYVIPIIIIENKKIFSAIYINLKLLFRCLWLSFTIVFIPTLLYVPVLMLRGIVDNSIFPPEMKILIMVLGIIIVIFIDATVYTSSTIFYLINKERA